MQINFNTRGLLVLLLLLSTCLLVTYGGRGGGGRGGSRGSGSRSRTPSRSRPTYRPAPRPSPRPAYRPSPKPAPKPTQKPPAAASPKPSAPDEHVVAKQPASNPNFKENNPVQGSADKQPAHNPNYKPESGAPGGPPPPYSPGGQPAPSAPVGAPPAYQPNQPSAPLGKPPPYGAPGQHPPYPQPGVQQPAYPGQPPAYPGLPGRPPAYPGQSAPYPQQPGYPGGHPQQPGYPGGYPQQPGYPGGYPQQPGMNRPYPVQPGYPGGYPQQPGGNRPYPVQPGASYPAGGYRPNPQQPLGGNVWQPQSGRPAPAYMNYGGMPTGTNMNTQPHKKKGFLGSLMSSGSSKPGKQNKYYGSYPGQYGAGHMGGGGFGRRGGGGVGGFLGRHGTSIAMMTILPYMAYKTLPFFFRPSYMFMPMFSPMHHYHHHHHGNMLYPEYAHYYDVYSSDYIGKCMKPIKKEHTEIVCRPTHKDIKCDARCEDGYDFPNNITFISNNCWHATGVWRPKKNFPDCKPTCDDECWNGGECIRPGVCKCPEEFRGDRCQFRKLNYQKCDVRKITKGEKHVGFVCTHFKNETVCKITCKEPAEFDSPVPEEYKCTTQGIWTPDTLPHCRTEKEKKEHID